MRPTWLLPLTFLAPACSNDTPAKPDMAAPDLAPAPPDFARAGLMSYRFVADKIDLPASKSAFAYDPIGDGTLRNKFGDIVHLVKVGDNLDLQMQEDALVAQGQELILFSFSTTDPMLVADPGAAVSVYSAVDMPSPDFSGAGNFTVDTNVPAGVVPGALAAGQFASPDARTLAHPPTVYLKITFIQGVAVNIPVVGVKVSFTPSTTALHTGVLTGALRETDVDKILIPALATALDQVAQQNPCGSDCMQVRQTFDENHDGHVTVDEVRDNGLVQAILAPDVALFGSDGVWHPDPTNANPDSISLGVGFSAVGASFTE